MRTQTVTLPMGWKFNVRTEGDESDEMIYATLIKPDGSEATFMTDRELPRGKVLENFITHMELRKL